ncbi:MAG: hypothetical protein H0T46_09045 [Deltaproteobacteria bacterium]|nr:hypothetical protein [Deltaproteobacteria bacterium]
MLSAALTGCYSPELRDCAVACASVDDCGPNQVCGSDRWCASPSLAGRCLTMATPDAAVGTDGAPGVIEDAAVDATVDAAPDAPTTLSLVVQIAGNGSVTIPGVGNCGYAAPNHQCTFTVMIGAQLMLTASGIDEFEFDKWQSAACAGQGATCTLTPLPPTTTIAVKFRRAN